MSSGPQASLPVSPGLFPDVPAASSFFTVESALSPALLVRTESRQVTLFGSVPGVAVPPPKFVAFGANGPKVVTNGVPTDVAKMQERWLLVWFLGQPGWEKLDCPWGVFLQEPLQNLSLDEKGLHLSFAKPAGTLAMMPLYGDRWLPGSAADAVAQGISREEYKTLPKVWEWSKAVPRDPLTRIRYWSSALVRYPYDAWVNVQDQADRWTFHTAFAWYETTNLWPIPPLKLAPVHPAVTSTFLTNIAAVRFGSQAFDMYLRTPVGPFWSVPETDRYSFSLLKSAVKPTGHSDPTTLPFGIQPATASQPWSAWSFGSVTPDAGESKPFRLVAHPVRNTKAGRTELVPMIEWYGSKAAASPRSLGAVTPGGSPLESATPEPLNGNTRRTRWVPYPQ